MAVEMKENALIRLKQDKLYELRLLCTKCNGLGFFCELEHLTRPGYLMLIEVLKLLSDLTEINAPGMGSKHLVWYPHYIPFPDWYIPVVWASRH